MISDLSREPGKYLTVTRDTVTPEGASRSRHLKSGTLILSNSGTVCVPKILAVEGCIHDGFVAFPSLPADMDKNYLYCWFEKIRPVVIQRNRQGMTQVNRNTEIVRSLPIPLAPLPEQHRIVAEVERRLSVIDELDAVIDANLRRAERLRQAILKRAFEGKLVPQDPNDEPASVLLERIRGERAAVTTGNSGRRGSRRAPTRRNSTRAAHALRHDHQ